MRCENLFAGGYRGHPTQANLRPRVRANVRSHGTECGGALRRGVCGCSRNWRKEFPMGAEPATTRETRMRRERRWSRHFDHYYWVTAFLASRGAQQPTCRVIAVVIFSLGVMPLALIESGVGPHNPRDRILAAVVAVCCSVMALGWLRRRWPTRNESRLCVAVGTICIAVACLMQVNPLVGLLGATAFCAVCSYAALFHTVRLLVVSWTVAAATIGILGFRLAAIDPVLAVCGVLLVVVVNVLAVFASRVILRLIDTEVLHQDLEPLTGLLNRAGFYEEFATLVAARSRKEDRYLVVAMIRLDGLSVCTRAGGASDANRARIAIAQQLRETARSTAIIGHFSDSEFVFAEVFPTAEPAPLAERIRNAVTTTSFHRTASIGVVSTPLSPLAEKPPYEVLDEVLALGATAVAEAREAGGNRIHYVQSFTLTVNVGSGNRDWFDTKQSAQFV
jgi:GGDEF domain-containing protein